MHTGFRSLSFVTVVLAASSVWGYDVKPFKLDIPREEVERMNALVAQTRLPSPPAFVGSANASLGVTRDWLADIKHELVSSYNWTEQQAHLNSFKQFTVEIGNATVHFVHEKSGAEGAIPLLMLHGWPGSFDEYTRTVANLTSGGLNSQGQNVSFDTWNNKDTARLFNTLMVDVLGYSTYALLSSDWGADIAYELYAGYTSTVTAAQFTFLPFPAPTRAQTDAANITLTPIGERFVQTNEKYQTSGIGYVEEQTFRPDTIGLALYDDPVGQLAWIGEMYKGSADPRLTAIDNSTIITAVALYYLTRSFLSSVWIYHANAFHSSYDVAPVATPMGFSQFAYDVGWPREYVEKVGNVTFYHEHEFGGHFKGIENPKAVVDDLREMAAFYEKK